MTNDPQALAAAVLEEAARVASIHSEFAEDEVRALVTPEMSQALDRAIAEAVARVRFDEREQAVRVAYGVLKNDCYCLTASNMEALASDLIIAIRKGESHD